jgi:hypothetical protein
MPVTLALLQTLSRLFKYLSLAGSSVEDAIKDELGSVPLLVGIRQ